MRAIAANPTAIVVKPNTAATHASNANNITNPNIKNSFYLINVRRGASDQMHDKRNEK